MIKITTTSGSLFEQKAHCHALLLEQDFSLKQLKDAQKEFAGLDQLIQGRKFTGKSQTSLVIPITHKEELCYMVLIGVGKKENNKTIPVENLRRALGKLVRITEDLKAGSIAIELPFVNYLVLLREHMASKWLKCLKLLTTILIPILLMKIVK